MSRPTPTAVASAALTSSVPSYGEDDVNNSLVADAAAYNEYASASVEVSNGHVATHSHLLTFVRSVRDIDRNSRRKFLYTIPLAASSSSSVPTLASTSSSSATEALPPIPPQELPKEVAWRLPSPSGDKIAVLIETSHTGGDTAAAKIDYVLEVWTHGGQHLERRIKLNPKLHGRVVWDVGGFGIPSWNALETALVYPAERVAPTVRSFFDPKDEENIMSAAPKAGASDHVPLSSIGGKYTVGWGKDESWGELYSKQAALVDLFCLDVTTGHVGKIRNVPGGDSDRCHDQSAWSSQGYALGQPVWSPDGTSVVYVGLDAGGGDEMPRRLGLVYCGQRPRKLYCSSVRNLVESLSRHKDRQDSGLSPTEDEPYIPLTPQLRIARSPRFSLRQTDDSYKLVFLATEKSFDTHFGCLGLHTLDWVDGVPVLASHSILVGQVWNPNNDDESRSSSRDRVDGMAFAGVYEQELLSSCFLSKDYMVLNTNWGSCTKVIRVSLISGAVDMLCIGTNHSSAELVCLAPDRSVVVLTKEPNRPGLLHCIPSSALVAETLALDLPVDQTFQLLSIAATRFSPVPQSPVLDFTAELRTLSSVPAVEGVDGSMVVQSILLRPDRSKHPNPPLIVVPHGGPHSVSTTSYQPFYAYLCGHGGYALLLVNYRGSIGFGQASVEALPTRIGTMDVADVVAATQELVATGLVDPQRVGICGGSHGGFLAAHCTAQFPDLFKAAVMRNPVVNIASMVTATDIPDWCYVEALGSYDPSKYRPPTKEAIDAMWEKSPVRHMEAVTAPTLVALGLSDLRVPPSQGREWYHSLRSMGVETRLLVYPEDAHAISGVEAEADHWVNIKRWFDKYFVVASLEQNSET